MAINVQNLVFDKVLRVAAFRKSDDAYLYGMTQVQDAALNGAAESTDVMDNVGAKIMTLYRAKTAQFSGSNALFDLGILAAQVGTEKKVGAALVPAFEIIEVGSEATVTLAHTPKGQITEIFALNGDSTLGTRYEGAEAASGTAFIHVADSNTITVPTGLAAGTKLFVMYDYEATDAISVINESNNFPKAVKLVIEALAYDPCDQNNKILVYITAKNAIMSADFDVTMAAGESHSFTYDLQQDYCDPDKKLYEVVVVED